jgi:hypothetical protein
MARLRPHKTLDSVAPPERGPDEGFDDNQTLLQIAERYVVSCHTRVAVSACYVESIATGAVYSAFQSIQAIQ